MLSFQHQILKKRCSTVLHIIIVLLSLLIYYYYHILIIKNVLIRVTQTQEHCRTFYIFKCYIQQRCSDLAVITSLAINGL